MNKFTPFGLWRRHPRVVATAILIFAVAALGVLGIAGTDSVWVPKCLFHSLTGLDCPGCGSQRAIAAALHGRIGEAWTLNPALWIGLCVAAVYALNPAAAGVSSRLKRFLYAAPTLLSLALLLVGWTVFRNL